MSIEAVTEVVSRLNGYMGRAYIRELFDPVQTHAVYGVPTEDVDSLKLALKGAGANRFRIVKSGIPSLKIVCFKVK